jgi:hypothetical protein
MEKLLTFMNYWLGKLYIRLQNDSDGKGDYIASWTHELPKPTQEQLK